MISMSKDDLTMFEQHIGAVAWVIVIGLLTWNVNTTNSMQIELAKFTTEIQYIKRQLDDRVITAKQFDSRMDILEKRIANLERVSDDENR